MTKFPSEMSAATAAKYDKPPVWQGVLMRFPNAVRAVAEVSAMGTKKHELPLNDMSYLDIPNAFNVYSDALGRHLIAEAQHGHFNEEDEGVLHAAQIAWNALARLEVLMRWLANNPDVVPEIAAPVTLPPAVGVCQGEFTPASEA